MSRVSFPAKSSSESRTITFDFTGKLSPGETLVSSIVTIDVYSGGDYFPENVLSGTTFITGSVVSQEVTAGTIGTTYILECNVTTSLGNDFNLEGLLTINGRISTAVSTVPGILESQSSAAAAAKASAISASEAASSASIALDCAIYRTVILINSTNSPYTLTTDKSGVLYVVDTTVAGVIINLPNTNTLFFPYTAGIKLAAGGNTVVINSDPADAIDGNLSTPITITSLENGVHVTATPGGWFSTNFGAGGGGGGTGNFSSNTNLSVDGEVVVFSGTGGHTGKRAQGTGIAKLLSGVLTTATAGTDYVSATSGTALQKGNGSGGLAAASAGSDYYAPGGALGTPSSGDLSNCTGAVLSGAASSAAKWTTPRLLAGNSVDGSANVAFANKFIAQGLSDSGLSSGQFLGNLATGLVKNTTNTGVLSIGAAGTDYVAPSGALGTPTSGVLTNCTGTASGLTSGTVTGLTVTAGKTLTVNNSITLAGTDSASLNIGAGGTLGSAAFTGFPAGTGIVLTSGGTTSLATAGTDYLAPGTAATITAIFTFTNDDFKLLGSSTGVTAFHSANASGTNYTVTFPAATDTVAVLATAQTWTAIQTYTNSDLKLLGSSTGATTFTSANAGVSNFTLTFPARTDTLTTLAGSEALTNKTYEGMTFAGTGTMTFPGASASIGYLGLPQNSKSAAYTTVLADAGKHLLHPSADTTARTFTIDSNANVAYAIGTTLTFVNQASAGVLTIAITSDTMRLAGAGTTGSRTLAANGIATALKLTSTEWIINGTNLT